MGFFDSADLRAPQYIGNECCGGEDLLRNVPTVECEDYCFYASVRTFDLADVSSKRSKEEIYNQKALQERSRGAFGADVMRMHSLGNLCA